MVNITTFKNRDSRLFFTLSGCVLTGSIIVPQYFDYHTVLSEDVRGAVTIRATFFNIPLFSEAC